MELMRNSSQWHPFGLFQPPLLVAYAAIICGWILKGFLPTAWASYIREDGPVEWGTVVALLMGAWFLVLRALGAGRRKRPGAWVLYLGALLLLFGAGEEISWGQRIFQVNPGAFFAQHNAQGETNLHNLVIGGVRINKAFFSLLPGLVLAFYYLILPGWWSLSRRLEALFPLPRPRPGHSLAFLILVLGVIIIPDPKKWELLELSLCLLVAATISRPANPFNPEG